MFSAIGAYCAEIVKRALHAVQLGEDLEQVQISHEHAQEPHSAGSPWPQASAVHACLGLRVVRSQAQQTVCLVCELLVFLVCWQAGMRGWPVHDGPGSKVLLHWWNV